MGTACETETEQRLEDRFAEGFADLSHTTPVGCDLYRARGYKVKLERARACTFDDRVNSLIEVRFHEAVNRGAPGQRDDFEMFVEAPRSGIPRNRVRAAPDAAWCEPPETECTRT